MHGRSNSAWISEKDKWTPALERISLRFGRKGVIADWHVDARDGSWEVRIGSSSDEWNPLDPCPLGSRIRLLVEITVSADRVVSAEQLLSP